MKLLNSTQVLEKGRFIMPVGTQFTATLNPNQTNIWYTFNWSTNWFVVWSVRPTSPSGKIELVKVEVERSNNLFTYFLTVRNTGTLPTAFEALYNYTPF